jgi:hypothetical protein
MYAYWKMAIQLTLGPTPPGGNAAELSGMQRHGVRCHSMLDRMALQSDLLVMHPDGAGCLDHNNKQ